MNKPLPAHCELPYFPVQDGQLTIAGRSVADLAEELGQTPFYAYDSGLIQQRIDTLRKTLPDGIQLRYAVKANPMPELIRFMAGGEGRGVDGFDIASAGELERVLDTNIPRQRVSFTGPGKGDDELRTALQAGIIINLESATELERVAALGQDLGIRPRVSLRINPDFQLRASGMRMGGGSSPFGVDAEQAPAVLAQIREKDLEFIGLHIFAGSQCLDAEAIMASQTEILALASKLATDSRMPLQELNLGGGFGIPYFPGEQPLALEPIGQHLETLCRQAEQDLPGTRLILELGRYLVGEAGMYVSRVLDRKVSRGQVFLVTDGGLHQHLAASGNFGQVIRKNFPVVIANRMGQADIEIASVVGRLCTPMDLLADRMELPVAGPGDLVAILQSGAYGLSASPTDFLSHPVPLEVLL